MKEALLTSGQRRLLDRYKAIGGVVEYVVLEVNPSGDVSIERLHRDAAVAGLKVVQRRTDEWAESVSRTQRIPRSRIFRMTLDLVKAKQIAGTPISHEKFLGPRYDFHRRGLIVRGKGEFLNEFFFNSNDPTPDNIIPPDAIDNGIGVGYAYAFSSPPYGVRVSAEETAELFEKINAFVLGGISSSSVIYRWPTGWSNYFEAGDEWWGSFPWTFANPGTSNVVTLAASATD